jgi:hypothetical protein
MRHDSVWDIEPETLVLASRQCVLFAFHAYAHAPRVYQELMAGKLEHFTVTAPQDEAEAWMLIEFHATKKFGYRVCCGPLEVFVPKAAIHSELVPIFDQVRLRARDWAKRRSFDIWLEKLNQQHPDVDDFVLTQAGGCKVTQEALWTSYQNFLFNYRGCFSEDAGAATTQEKFCALLNTTCLENGNGPVEV